MHIFKRSAVILMALLFVLCICPSAFAQEHNIDELYCTIDLPETWRVATRKEYEPTFVKARWGYETDEEWQSFMKSYELYMFAAVPDDTDKQHEIFVSQYDDFNEQIDYDQLYDAELNQYGKKSMEDNNKHSEKGQTYTSYEIVAGRENLKFLKFNYTGSDGDGNPTYGVLYHTVKNGLAMDFDMSCYKGNPDQEFLDVFEQMVLTARFETVAESDVWLTPRRKQNLTYIALLLLAVAFVVVIVVFSISKVNESKQYKQAVEEMKQQQTDEEDEDDDEDDEEALGDFELDEEDDE